MGFEDIVYDLIKEYRTSKFDKQKQTELAKSISKKAYLRFNFDWVTEKESQRMSQVFLTRRIILESYSQVFLDIAVEIYDILPEESDRLKKMATKMKTGAHGIRTSNSDSITPVGDKCADEVMEYVNDLS